MIINIRKFTRIQNRMKKNIANYITSLRIIGTIVLLFLRPFGEDGRLLPTFFIVYTLCGLSDVVDGTFARATGTTSVLGAKLDSFADLSYYAVMAIKILPVLIDVLTTPIWCIVAADFLIRIISYVYVALKYHKFSSMHTYLNKMTGLAVFTIPYYITTSCAIPLAYTGAIIAGLASIEELVLHLCGRSKGFLNGDGTKAVSEIVAARASGEESKK